MGQGDPRGQHQGGMKRRVAGISERDVMKLPRRQFLHLAARAAALPAFAILISAASVAVWATVAQAQTATERYNLQDRCGKVAAEVFAKEWGTGFSNMMLLARADEVIE